MNHLYWQNCTDIQQSMISKSYKTVKDVNVKFKVTLHEQGRYRGTLQY